MSLIPATRNKRLVKPEQDQLQWNLTQGHSKRHCSELLHVKHQFNNSVTTEQIANKFVQFLYNTKEAEAKLDQMAKDITFMCQNVSFSSAQFNQIVSEQAVNSVRLLEYYYKLYIRLKVLALSLSSILQHVQNLDETLLDLISRNDTVAKAYIPHLPDELLDELFEKDGRQLTSWTALMKPNNAQRLHFILEHYTESMSFDQLKTILIRLMSFHKVRPKGSDENLNKCFYRQLRHVKQCLFNTAQRQAKEYDSFLAKKPVYLLMSQWFFEFNVKSDHSLTEFIAHIASVGSSLENGSEVMDMSLLLYLYFTACKDLNASGEDVLRIFDIIEAVNTAVKQSLERDESSELGVILALTQIALEHMHTSVGYTYASWFEATFVRSSTSILDKKTSAIFIKILQQMTLYELPSILQIQGKALSNCTTIPNSQLYVSAVRKRLLELGLNQHLKSYPVSIKTPLQAEIIAETPNVSSEVEDVLREFIQKNNSVPKSLLQAHVFRRQWFVATFLPKLFAWQGRDIEARNNLIMALKELNKIPDSLYKPFMQQQKKA
ncbi:hypothetical protein PS15m_006045 [Mucor circinelloides]